MKKLMFATLALVLFTPSYFGHKTPQLLPKKSKPRSL